VGPATPTALNATRGGATTINLTWNPAAGAANYEIARRCTNAGYTTVATTSMTSFANTVPSGSACLYQVRAIDAFSRYSPYSAADLATTFAFTDDPLVAGATTIKFVHVNELRQAIDALRTTAGLGSWSFTAPAPAVGTKPRAVHIHELRSALHDARMALGMSALAYTDPLVDAGFVVKAAHMQELRNSLK
jgi:hypothetical protein